MIFACDVGGTWIKSAYCVGKDAIPRLLEHRRDRTPREGDLLDALVGLLQSRLRERPARCVTIAIAGNVDTSGVVLHTTNLPLATPCRMADRLSAELGVPVTVENDANAAALAVARLPQADGLDPLVVVTLGTGVGGGIVLDGRLQTGSLGTAGEIGHLVLNPEGPLCRCGKRGCMEAICGEAGILARYRNRTGEAVASTEALFRRLEAGEDAARDTVKETGEWLGRGLALISDIIAPRGFFLVGGVAGFGSILVETVQDTLARTCFLRHVNGVPVVQGIPDDPWIGLKGAVERVR